jgi:hypothetical protein
MSSNAPNNKPNPMESWPVQLASWLVALIAVIGIVLAYNAGAFSAHPADMFSHVLFPLAWVVLGFCMIPIAFGVDKLLDGCFISLVLLLGGPILGVVGLIWYLGTYPYIP